MLTSKSARGRLLAAAVLLPPTLLACPSTPYPERKVDLLPKGAPAVSELAPPAAKLRFSVAAMLSPQGSLSAYSHLFELMAERTGYEVEFVQRKTYREVNDLLLAGQVDAALVCTGGYLELARSAPGKVELLAVPLVGGVTTYHSYVLVPAASPAKSMADLAGKRFAFTDELSLTGRAYAIHWLTRRGADPATFFGNVQLTRSHDRSVEAVAKGLVDGACVDSLIFDEMVKARPELGKAVRRIDVSPPFGAPPVVAATTIPADRRAAIRDVLLGLAKDAEGRKALAAIGFDGFAAVAPSHYDGARAVAEATW
jgi:phosphonate transport system substrate-binding protein